MTPESHHIIRIRGPWQCTSGFTTARFIFDDSLSANEILQLAHSGTLNDPISGCRDSLRISRNFNWPRFSETGPLKVQLVIDGLPKAATVILNDLVLVADQAHEVFELHSNLKLVNKLEVQIDQTVDSDTSFGPCELRIFEGD